MADLKREPMLGLYPDDIDLPGREVPPNLPTRVKIKLRECLIVGLTTLLAVAAGLMPLATMARVGLVTFIACAGLLLALGRFTRTGGSILGLFCEKDQFLVEIESICKRGKRR